MSRPASWVVHDREVELCGACVAEMLTSDGRKLGIGSDAVILLDSTVRECSVWQLRSDTKMALVRLLAEGDGQHCISDKYHLDKKLTRFREHLRVLLNEVHGVIEFPASSAARDRPRSARGT